MYFWHTKITSLTSSHYLFTYPYNRTNQHHLHPFFSIWKRFFRHQVVMCCNCALQQCINKTNLVVAGCFRIKILLEHCRGNVRLVERERERYLSFVLTVRRINTTRMVCNKIVYQNKTCLTIQEETQKKTTELCLLRGISSFEFCGGGGYYFTTTIRKWNNWVVYFQKRELLFC